MRGGLSAGSLLGRQKGYRQVLQHKILTHTGAFDCLKGIKYHFDTLTAEVAHLLLINQRYYALATK